MTSQKVQDEAIEMLSNQLMSSKVITKEQKLEDVYKGGKSRLISSLKQRAENGNAEYALNIKDAALTEEEKSKVKQVAAQMAIEKGNDYSQVKASEVLGMVNTSDGSKSKSSNKNPKDSTNGMESKQDSGETKIKEIAITSYLEHIQKLQPTPPPKSEEEVKKLVQEKVKNRKKKLEQILKLDIQDDSEFDNTTDFAISTANAIKNGNKRTFTSKKGKKIELESSEASDVLELLLMRKEMETINEFAEKELEIKKGSRQYNENVKKKTQSAIDYYRAQIEIETMKQANPTLTYTKTETEGIKDKNEKTTIDKEQKKFLEAVNQLQVLEKKKKEDEKAIASRGPIVDIDEFIAETFNKKKK